MLHFHKHILTDEQRRPVAVQVRYEDWLEIERLLEQVPQQMSGSRLMRHAGKLNLDQDPLAFQHEIRGEWP